MPYGVYSQALIKSGTCYEALRCIEGYSQKDTIDILQTFFRLYDFENSINNRLKKELEDKSFYYVKEYFKKNSQYRCTIKFESTERKILLKAECNVEKYDKS